jgi:hypothetical protein
VSSVEEITVYLVDASEEHKPLQNFLETLYASARLLAVQS